MKASELRKISAEELKIKSADLKQELFNVRFQLHTGRLENSSKINAIRKQVEVINNSGGENLVNLAAGDEVIIQDGPFSGYKAIFDLSLSGNERVLVLLKLLKNQQMRLELPANQVKKRK